MEDWRIDRIDFVDSAPCHFCNRRLKSNIAYILVAMGLKFHLAPRVQRASERPRRAVGDGVRAFDNLISMAYKALLYTPC